MATIGIWGDSIVYGESDIDGFGWATRARKYLSSRVEGTNLDWLNVYVRGVCGEKSKDLLRRFAVEAESTQPDVIVIAIGINDAAYIDDKENTRVPLSEYEENLQQLVREAEKYTQKIIFVGLTHVNEASVQPLPDSPKGKSYSNDIIEQYDSVIQKVATDNAKYFIAVRNVLTDSDLEDGLHPTSLGHQKLAECIIPLLEDVLVKNQ